MKVARNGMTIILEGQHMFQNVGSEVKTSSYLCSELLTVVLSYFSDISEEKEMSDV